MACSYTNFEKVIIYNKEINNDINLNSLYKDINEKVKNNDLIILLGANYAEMCIIKEDSLVPLKEIALEEKGCSKLKVIIEEIGNYEKNKILVTSERLLCCENNVEELLFIESKKMFDKYSYIHKI